MSAIDNTIERKLKHKIIISVTLFPLLGRMFTQIKEVAHPVKIGIIVSLKYHNFISDLRIFENI